MILAGVFLIFAKIKKTKSFFTLAFYEFKKVLFLQKAAWTILSPNIYFQVKLKSKATIYSLQKKCSNW